MRGRALGARIPQCRRCHIVRPANIAEISDEEFEEYFFLRQNPKGLIYERWRHIHGCGRFFNAARDTVSDRFHVTYKAGEPRPDLNAEPKTSETVETYEALEGVAE